MASVTFHIWSCNHDSVDVCVLKTERALLLPGRVSDTALLTNFISLPELGRCCRLKRKRYNLGAFVSVWRIAFQEPRHHGQPRKAINLSDLPRDVRQASGDLTLSTQPLSEMCQWYISGSQTNPYFIMYCGLQSHWLMSSCLNQLICLIVPLTQCSIPL